MFLFFRIQHVKSDSGRYWRKEFYQWNKIYRFSQWKCSWLFRLPWARESFIRYPNMNKEGPRAMQAIAWLMIIQNLVIGHFFDVNFRLWSSKIYITILKITTNKQSLRAPRINYFYEFVSFLGCARAKSKLLCVGVISLVVLIMIIVPLTRKIEEEASMYLH